MSMVAVATVLLTSHKIIARENNWEFQDPS